VDSIIHEVYIIHARFYNTNVNFDFDSINFFFSLIIRARKRWRLNWIEIKVNLYWWKWEHKIIFVVIMAGRCHFVAVKCKEQRVMVIVFFFCVVLSLAMTFSTLHFRVVCLGVNKLFLLIIESGSSINHRDFE